MNAADFRFGFRIVGDCTEARRLVDSTAAFAGYCRCDANADVTREAYLSAFTFDAAMQRRADRWNRLDVKGFDGPTYSPFIWFDIDRPDREQARRDTARLVGVIAERYKLDADELLIFFSGNKGFHVALPSILTAATPGPTFHATARRLAEGLAAIARIEIDSGVYDRVRAFRAPNSRHAKTGLHKRLLTFDELGQLSAERIAELAREPFAFDPAELPSATAFVNQQAAADWRDAESATAQRQSVQAAFNGTARLTRSTRAFMADGATEGDRHRLLFSAAANLAELGCPLSAIEALLMEPALDSGLSPSDAKRQIRCGWEHGNKGMAEPTATQQAEAIAEPPGRDAAPAPAAKPTSTDKVTPPPGAKLHFIDDRQRPCRADRATRWTWEGAKQWHSIDQLSFNKGDSR
jgi:hypothetical protein